MRVCGGNIQISPLVTYETEPESHIMSTRKIGISRDKVKSAASKIRYSFRSSKNLRLERNITAARITTCSLLIRMKNAFMFVYGL